MGKILQFLGTVLKGSGLITATAAGGATAVGAVDYATTGGANVKHWLGGFMKMFGQSQNDAGQETAFFGLAKMLDKLIELYVGLGGRNSFTDWARTGLQQYMGRTPDQLELGSPAKPASLTNPSSPGYIGGPAPDGSAPAGTVVTLDANGQPVTTPAGPGKIHDLGSFVTSLKNDFASVVEPNIVNGEAHGFKINGEAVLNGTGNNLKAAYQGFSTGVGGILGFGADAANLLDNFTGLNWIPDQEKSYTSIASDAFSDAAGRLEDNLLGGRAQTDDSALAMSFNVAGQFLPSTLAGPAGMAVKVATVGYGAMELKDALYPAPAPKPPGTN